MSHYSVRYTIISMAKKETKNSALIDAINDDDAQKKAQAYVDGHSERKKSLAIRIDSVMPIRSAL